MRSLRKPRRALSQSERDVLIVTTARAGTSLYHSHMSGLGPLIIDRRPAQRGRSESFVNRAQRYINGLCVWSDTL